MISSLTMRKCHATMLLLLLGLGLSACSQNNSGIDITVDGDAEIKMSPPALLSSRMIDPDNLQLTVTINDDAVPMSKRGETWTGSTTVPKDSTVTLKVEWHELMADISEPLLLATAEDTSELVQRAISFNVIESSYVTEGVGFDLDGDLLSNIVERRQGSDPNDANDPGVGPAADVKVLAHSRPNVIDGTFKDGTGFWDNATFSDVFGQTLLINNLIVSESNNTDGAEEPDYQWAAIHDTRYLTLFIWGKRLAEEGVDANGDSGLQFFNDDSVEIFWDGDYSQLEDGYDDVDDMHIIIPFLRGTEPNLELNNSAAEDRRVFRGANVRREVTFDVYDNTLVEFATCFCAAGNDRMTWEIRIDMEAARIPVGKTFGFEIQMNRDDDGGARDSKWAWDLESIQPGQTNAEVDVTWRYASEMGKIQLLPFPARSN